MRRGFTPLDRRGHLTGFTLLEAIIAVGLLGLVGVSFAYLFSMSHRLMIQSMNSSTSQGEAAFALEHIKRHLMVATAVATPVAPVPPATSASGPELTFRWRRSAGQLELQSDYTLDGINQLQVVITTYNADETVNNVAPAEIIARGIRAITFTRATSGMISVNVTARKTTGGDSRDMSLQTSISPRGLSQ